MPEYVIGDFDRDHIQLTWGGSLPGAETWSCSLKLGDARPGSPVIGNDAYIAAMDMADFVDFVKDPIEAYHYHTDTWISDTCLLEWCKVAVIQHDGRMQAGDASQVHFWSTPVTGYPNAGRVLYPNQVALAVSLTTTLTRGPAHRGRFYLPQPSMPLGIDGLISTIDAQRVADSTKTFIEAISDVPGVDIPSSPGVIVMSRKSGAATAHICEGVEVGRVLDTQRRRRRSLPESYVTADIDQGVA